MSSEPSPHSGAGGRAAGWAVVLAVGLAILSIATADDMGLTWDEAYYQYAEERQRDWFRLLLEAPGEALGAEVIEEHWNYDPDHNPHPPVYKILVNLGYVASARWLDPLVASRVMPGVLYGATAALIFGLVRRRRSDGEALGAALLWATMPRIFAHGHVGATDLPMSCFAVASVWLFLAALERKALAVPLGGIFGLAFATKFTAVLLPVPMGLWALLYRERRAVPVLAISGLVTPLVAVLATPYWWHDPFGGILEFIQVSTSRETGTPISVVYWGVVHSFRAPWHYPWVMLALATPLTAWLPAVIAVVRMARERGRDREGLLCLFAFAVPIAVVSLPSSPKHDGLRMFLPALPFLAALGARGIAALFEGASGGRAPRRVALAIAAAVALQVLSLGLYHPHQLSYYNVLVGGLRGASRAGLEISYWMEVFTPEVRADLNDPAILPEGASVSVVVGDPFYFKWLQHTGHVRADLNFFHVDVGEEVDLGLFASRVSTLGPDGMAMLEQMPKRYRYPADPAEVPFVQLISRSDGRSSDALEASRDVEP